MSNRSDETSLWYESLSAWKRCMVYTKYLTQNTDQFHRPFNVNVLDQKVTVVVTSKLEIKLAAFVSFNFTFI